MTGTIRDMSLICARLSCGLAAAASVQFNADLAQVVIIDLSDSTAGIPLCHDHTRTRTPPMGWTLIDARTGVRQGVMLDTPSIVEPEAVPADGSGPGNRPARRRPLERGFVWERVSDPATEEIIPKTEVLSEAEPEDDDVIDGPTSPLLSRAFRAAHSDRVDDRPGR